MKNKILVLLLALTLFQLDVMSSTSRDGDPLPLTIVPPPPVNGNGGPHRNLPTDIIVYQDANSLTFDLQFVGFEIELLYNDDEVVFTDMIDEEGTVELPSNLSGIYTLRLYVGDVIYQGEITL